MSIIEDGREVELRNPAAELGGSGPGEGRMLIVARDGDTTYHLGLVISDRMTTDPSCHAIISAAAWDTPEGIVFRSRPPMSAYACRPDGSVHDPSG